MQKEELCLPMDGGCFGILKNFLSLFDDDYNDVIDAKAFLKKADVCVLDKTNQNGNPKKIFNDEILSKQKIENKNNLINLKKDGMLLQKIQHQTPRLCLEAVRQNGLALQYVTDQTPEICLEAIKNNEKARKFVKNETMKLFV